MKLSERMVSAAPLIEAVAVCERDGLEATNVKLAELSGRSDKNIPRDLTSLVEAGWIIRETGSRPTLTDEGREILAALGRANGEAGGAQDYPLHLIDEDPDHNPRKTPNAVEDAELAASVGDKGVLQPILIRPSAEPGRFLVVAGHRRRRAAIAAGHFIIPAKVTDMDADEAFEAATVENVQRENMNAIDTANAYQLMIERRMSRADNPLTFTAAKEEVAQVVRKSVRLVELKLQCLTLPPVKQAEIVAGKTSFKEAIAWQREQPVELSPRTRLVLAEIVDSLKRNNFAGLGDRVEVRAKTVREDRGGNGTKISYKLENPGPGDVTAIAELTKRDVLVGISERVELGVELGLYVLRLGWAGEKIAKFELPEIYKDDKRPAILRELRVALMGEYAADQLAEGQYATAWLNGPFEMSAKVAQELEAKRKANDTATALAAAEQDAAAKAHQEKIQWSRDRWDRMAASETGLQPQVSSDLAAAVGALAVEAELKLPLYVSREGIICDAVGRVIVNRPFYAEDALVSRPQLRLLVAVVNAAAGLLSPVFDPMIAGNTIPRPEFEKIIAGLLAEDDDLPEGEAGDAEALERAKLGLDAFLTQEKTQYGDPQYDWEETGAMALAEGIRIDGLGQDTAAPAVADGDEEFSPALLRLAGGRDGEARS